MKPLLTYAALTCLASIGWFLRMLLDPVIDVVRLPLDASPRVISGNR
jgi:hypothetical protein